MKSRQHHPRLNSFVAVTLAAAAMASCTSSDANSDPALISATVVAEDSTTAQANTSTTIPAQAAAQAIQNRVAQHVGCLEPVSRVADQEWSYCRATDDLELIRIEWVTGDVLNTEIFALADGSVAYALQATGQVEGGIEVGPWMVEYVIHDDVVVDHWSIGLGVTESDDWDPDAIIDRWVEREAMAVEIRAVN